MSSIARVPYFSLVPSCVKALIGFSAAVAQSSLGPRLV